MQFITLIITLVRENRATLNSIIKNHNQRNKHCFFQFMHCFEGHHVTTLGEITSKEGSRHEIQELDSINRLVQVG